MCKEAITFKFGHIIVNKIVVLSGKVKESNVCISLVLSN